MSMHSMTTIPWLRRSQILPLDEVGARPQPRPFPFTLTVLVFLVSTLLILGVLTVVRTETRPSMLDPPLTYLPGSVLPASEYRLSPTGERYPNYFVRWIDRSDFDLYINFDPSTGRITRTLIFVDEYRLGDLILSWGRPTGVRRTEHFTYVDWANRSVFFATRSIGPDSQAETVEYTLEPQQASPWHGFVRCNDSDT